MGLLPLPWWLRRDHQAVSQQEPQAQVDGYVGLAEAPDHLAVGPPDERMPVSLLGPTRSDRLVQGQSSHLM